MGLGGEMDTMNRIEELKREIKERRAEIERIQEACSHLNIIENKWGNEHPDDIIVKGLKMRIVYTKPIIIAPYIPVKFSCAVRRPLERLVRF